MFIYFKNESFINNDINFDTFAIYKRIRKYYLLIL